MPAVKFEDCPTYRNGATRCQCEPRCECGMRKHTAIHAARFGQSSDSEPWGHEYKPVKMKNV